jgi:hypothetical protein
MTARAAFVNRTLGGWHLEADRRAQLHLARFLKNPHFGRGQKARPTRLEREQR